MPGSLVGNEFVMLIALLLAHFVLAAVVLLGRERLGRASWLVGGVAPLATLVWLATRTGAISRGDEPTSSFTWVESLGLTIDLRVTAFSALMILLISGIGVLVFAYGYSYFGSSENGPRAAGLLTLFAGAMLGVVVADNLLVLYVFWELTSVTSYLLIGIDDTKPEARSAAQHALLVTGLGGLVMLGGLVLLGQQGGTYRISELLAEPPRGSTVAAALVLILVGAFTKSAQYPFHSWLPGAMVAPTPISAYLHSAAMVKAGVYVVALLAPAFADVGVWRPLVVIVGLVTMIAGGLRAQLPFDLKQLLAFGTISQLGFLMVLFGIGRPEATTAGCALILAHGLFKAALFMVVGVVDHETGTRDIRELPALGPGWSATKTVAVLSAASMAAVPPLAGFIAKEEAYAALVHGGTGDRIVLAGVVAGSVLTVAYSLRFVLGLLRPVVVSPENSTTEPAHHHPPMAFIAPAVVLAAATVAFGVVPAIWSPIVDHAAHALDETAHAHLALWHGFNAALWLSALTLLLGVGLFAVRRPFGAVLKRLAPRVSGLDAYQWLLRGLTVGAARLTRLVQPGSLPVYATVVLGTAALAPLIVLLTAGDTVPWPATLDRVAQIPAVAVILVGAVAATVARRRFAAVLLLGLVGYAMAALFVIHGAPDLALTQFGVETLFVVVFLLVLRRLPARFDETQSRKRHTVRVAVAAAVGVFVVAMGIMTAGSRTATPVSTEMAELAYAEGEGRNVVNVILVDIRGYDTLGEITVLVTAALGIVALARSGVGPRARRSRAERRQRVTEGTAP